MPLTVKEKIARKIRASKDNAFVRKEFENLGGYRQVSRALADLVQEGKLVRAGQGIWARAKEIYIPGLMDAPKATAVTDVMTVAMEALPKLGYVVRYGSKIEDNKMRKSTQVPYAPMVKIEGGRTARKIRVNEISVVYEKNQ